MADKKITDLTLRDNVTDTVNFPVDDTIQSYRVTAAQIKDYVLPNGAVTTAKLADGVFSGLSAVTAAFDDSVAIADTSDSGNKKKALVSSIINESITVIDNSDSPYAVAATDRTIIANSTSGAITINLPAAASNTGRKLKIKKINAGGNLVTLDGNSAETIDGEATATLWFKNDVMLLVCDGSNWYLENEALGTIKPRAWVNSSAQTVTNRSATYSRTGTTVTVTYNDHGHRVGHKIRFDATSGSATDGSFRVTSVPNANTFTFVHGSSGSTSGNCNLPWLGIYNSKNVHSVVPTGANTQNAENTVNLSIDLPDTDYIVMSSTRNAGAAGNDNGTSSVRFCAEVDVSTDRTINSFKMFGATTSSSSSDHQICAVVFK